MKTKMDTIMENIAILDTLTREGYSENVIDRVERAVNSHEALLELALLVRRTLLKSGPDLHLRMLRDKADETIGRLVGDK